MDDHEEARIAALFRDAASGAPPPGFDAAEVVATSRRITRRRRSAMAGAALAVLAVVGVGVVAGFGGPGEATVAASSGQAAEQTGTAGGSGAGSDDAARAAAPEAAVAPDAGGAATGSPFAATAPEAAVVPPVSAPLGPGPADRCADRQDPALRALVEQALPEVVGAPEAATTLECRPGGERSVALEVDGGLLTVTYLPSGSVPEAPAGARAVSTASGGTVVVWSRAGRAGDPVPFAEQLDSLVAALAPRL